MLPGGWVVVVSRSVSGEDTTKEKSDAIKTEQDNIEEFAAAMQENTDGAAEETMKIAKLNDMITSITKQIETITAMREAESAQYEGAAIDLAKGTATSLCILPFFGMVFTCRPGVRTISHAPLRMLQTTSCLR